nr:hypothetical protein [Tanacetum cinerariifolium]
MYKEYLTIGTQLKLLKTLSKEAPKGWFSKAPAGSKTGHSKKRKESSSVMDSNPSQALISTPVDTRMQKKDQQATGGPTSLGFTSEERANLQLSSDMSTFILNKAIYSTSLIFHSESASENDASAVSTAKADPGNSNPSDFVPQQHGMNKGTKNTSYDHLFADLDSPKDDHIIVVDDTDEDEIHVATNDETEDTSSQKHKLELEKNKAKAALLKAQPSFPNVEQLNELQIKLKKQVHELEIEIPGDLKEIPTKLKDFTKTVTSLTSQVAEALVKCYTSFEQICSYLKLCFIKSWRYSVLSACQANTKPPEGEKDINQATISQFFQRRDNKNVVKDNLNKNKPQTKTTRPPNPPIITTTTQMQSPFLQPPPKSSFQPEGEDIKEDKGKKALTKKLKKFDFITKDGRHIHLIEEEINHQKKLEEDAKAEAAKQEGEVRKAELVNMLGPELTEDSDAYDSDCDDISSAKAVLMANLSSYDSNVLFEIPYSNTYSNDRINQDVQEMSYSKQTHIVDFQNNEITNDSNIISYSQYMQESQNTALKNEIRKLKGKNVVDSAVSTPSATIAPIIFKLDIEPISHRLKNNRDSHEELLVYVSNTCPSLTKPTEKLIAIKPMNKDKKVRFAEPFTSSSNIPKQTDSLKTKDSNKPLLTSTGVKPTTSASGSKPSSNTKNSRIMRPPSSNQKNKVEEHPRKVKSSLNKMNYVYEPNSIAHVKHSIRNAKFESICAICKKCLFDANHDMYVINYVNDVNVCSKSKSKRNKIRKIWKPTGKVFNEIGYSWKPTGRTSSIVRNKCPLTRINSTKVVPTKETTNKLVLTPTQGIIVHSRKPKASRSVGSTSKAKIVESKTSNTKEPKQSWGSTVSAVLSSSLIDCMLSKFFSPIWTPNTPSM